MRTSIVGAVFLALVGVFINAAPQNEPLTEGMALWSDIKEFTIEPLIPIGEEVVNEYPAIAIDGNDAVWVAWMKMVDGRDGIFLASYKDGKWSDPMQVSTVLGYEYEPQIVCDAQNVLWIVWTGKREGNWDLYARSYAAGKFGDEVRLTTDASIDRRAAIRLDKMNRLWVAWESDRAGNFDILCTTFDGKKAGEVRAVTTREHDDFRPAITIDKEGTVWVAWDSYVGPGDYDVFLAQHEEPSGWSAPISVTAHPALDAHPALGVDQQNRVWIAYHSNRQGKDRWDLPKWIYLRCYDGEHLNEPVAPMPGVNFTKKAMDQGFEFPTMLIDRSNRIWVFGRPSQNFCMQFYHGNGWSPLIRLPKEGWGGRGKLIHAAEDSQGAIWLVRRSLQENTLQKISNLSMDSKPPEVRRITLEPKNRDLSNVLPDAERKTVGDYKVYYGQIHAHTWMSDGGGTLDEFYTRSRDIYKLDFGSLTDHGSFVGNRITPTEWEEQKAVSTHYNEPGRFVTLYSYEWTTARPPRGYGHKNVYFLDETQPLLSMADDPYNTTPELFAALKERGGLAFPHHIGWTYLRWDLHDPSVQSCVEICSTHGVFEYMGNEPIKHRGGIPGYFVQDGLAKGLRFGIIGGSDGHGLIWHHGVGYKHDSWQTGLAGVYAKELTREAIFDALRNRRTFATTGVKIFVDFQADGHFMGEEYETDKPPTFRINVDGTDYIKYIYLVRNNENILCNGGDSFSSSITYTDENIPAGTSYYYVRVLQKNNDMAWSSPIWITYRPKQ